MPGFGALLRRLRLAAGLTQEVLAERAGVSAKAVGGLERDPRRAPRLDTVGLLADALGLESVERARFIAAARSDSVPPPAPAAALSPQPALPRPLTPLIGREEVAGAVAALLWGGESQLLTLTGPGGVGKTRLAIEVAARVADDFSDGTVFVDLAPLRDPDLLLPTIAQNVGLDERERGPLPARLLAALRPRQVLLVLDNMEHLIASRDEVLALVEACPRLVVLATSRVALRVRGERECPIAPLELPAEDATLDALSQAAATMLFMERARAVGVTVEATAEGVQAVAQICRRLDGLPLAIELAAAWTRLLPLPALSARFDHRLSLLVGGAYDLPARQRTMRDTIDWSYALLDPEEQKLFRQLAVFVGGCSPEAAGAVCAEPGAESDMLPRLAALVDKSLLRRSGSGGTLGLSPRLVMLETLREFGLECLEREPSGQGESEVVRRRHAAYFLALAEATEPGLAGPDGRDWGDRLAQDHDNLRAALEWLLACGDGERALRLAGVLSRFWLERGHLSEGRRWLRAALSASDDEDQAFANVLTKALIGAAALAADQAVFDEAADLCARAEALAREREAWPDLIAALNTRGMIAYRRGEYPAAVGHYEEAQALAEGVGDRAGMAVALSGLVYASVFSGDAAKARVLSEQSLAIFREIGDWRGLAHALVGTATHAVFFADYARAEVAGTEALAYFRALGDGGRMAEALWVLGIAAQFQGEQERAAAQFGECLSLRRMRGDEFGTVQPLTALGQIALHAGEHLRAKELIEETLAITRRYEDPWGRAMSLALLVLQLQLYGRVAMLRW